MPPGFAAREARRSMIFRTSLTPYVRGLTAIQTDTPFGGGFNSLAEISLKLFGTLATQAEVRVQAYAGLLAGLSLLVAAGLALGGYGLGDPWAVGALCLAGALAQRGQMQVSGALKVSISLFPILLAAVLFGPIAAMLVSVSSMLAEETNPLTRWVLYTSSRSLTGAAAGLIADRARPFKLSWSSRYERGRGGLYADSRPRLCCRRIHAQRAWQPLDRGADPWPALVHFVAVVRTRSRPLGAGI